MRRSQPWIAGYPLQGFIVPGSDIEAIDLDVFGRRNLGNRYRYTLRRRMRSRCSAAGVRGVGSSGDGDDAQDGTRGGRSVEAHGADTGDEEAAQGPMRMLRESNNLLHDLTVYCTAHIVQ